ncbi:MAG: T9SS type A sorting domain-containing protein, partial [Cyclobacteriaceae bacterium]|nr:T9SS type A sorting domain-containing protein [Cyclobacteriaceae bacterium]
IHAEDKGSEPVEFIEDAKRGTVASFSAAAHAQFPLPSQTSVLDFGVEDFSVSVWVKIDPNIPIAGDPAILSNKDWNSGRNQGFLLALDGPDDPTSHQWTVNVADGGGGRLDWDADDNQTPNLKDGDWHNVTITFDRDLKLNVYYDGVLKQTDVAQDSYDLTLTPGSLSAADLPLTIMQDATGAYSKDFAALLDDLRIWKGRILTPEEIVEIYAPDAYGAEVYLPLDIDLKDAGIYKADAVDKGAGAAKFVVDNIRGSVVEFPVDAHAQFPLIADAPVLDFGTTDFTIGFWVRIDANVPVPGDPVIIGNKDWGSGRNQGFEIGLDGADDASAHWWTVNVSDGGGSRLDWDADDNAAINLKDGDWHFVVTVFDRGSGKLFVYVDGELFQNDPAQDSFDLSLVPGSLSPADLPLTIMQDATGAYSDDFSARLDNIRIWKSALTAADVEKIFLSDEGNLSGGGPLDVVLSAEEYVPEFKTIAYPNPFGAVTTIRYNMETKERVRIAVLNSIGQIVSVLEDDVKEKGIHEVSWHARGQRPGLYFYTIMKSNERIVGQIILLGN